MYREVLVPVDNSQYSDWAVDRAIELCRKSGGRITGNHVYAARLHDVRFRQLETGLPAQFQTPEEIKRQRLVHDKLIEKGLQLISDSFLDQMERRCGDRGVPLRRQLLEGINYEEIVKEVNRGGGQLPSLIGFDPNIAANYDGGSKMRSDVRLGEDGRIVGEHEDQAEKLAGSSGRDYDLLVIGAHGIGRQPYSQLGGVVSRVARGIEKDMLVVRDDRPLDGGKFMVCVDGSAYSYRAMRVALELARAFGGTVYACSAFDVEYHHAVFNNIKDVLSVKAKKVFKFEEQEELHNNIIDKGLLKLCQANLKRAEVMAREFEDVPLVTQILVGKPFQVILQWAEEIQPSLMIVGRHGAHRIDGTEFGSQVENLIRLAPASLLVTGTVGIRPEDIPWIEEDGQAGLPWAPDAEVRILRVPPFAQGIARRAVEEFVLEHGGDIVTSPRLDEAIRKLLPTHMQLIMGIGDAEEIARAELKAEEQMAKTLVLGSDDDVEPAGAMVDVKCPVTPSRHAAGADRDRSARLDRRGVRAPEGGAAHRAAAGPQHGRALRAQPRRVAHHHVGHGREQAGDDRGRRVRRRDDDGDVPGVAGEADPRGSRGRGRAVAGDAAVHRRGEGHRRHALPHPRHGTTGEEVPGRFQDDVARRCEGSDGTVPST